MCHPFHPSHVWPHPTGHNGAPAAKWGLGRRSHKRSVQQDLRHFLHQLQERVPYMDPREVLQTLPKEGNVVILHHIWEFSVCFYVVSFVILCVCDICCSTKSQSFLARIEPVGKSWLVIALESLRVTHECFVHILVNILWCSGEEGVVIKDYD